MLQLRHLTDTATILVSTEGTADSHGNKPLTWTTGSTAKCLLQQQQSTEVLDQRDAVTTRSILFFAPGATVTAFSRVQLASVPDVTWRVVGDPAKETSLSGRPSHIEAIVERVAS